MMKSTFALGAALLLSACGYGGGTGASTADLNNGADTSFLQQGVSSCPNINISNNPIYERYPLRCGPQSQVIPQ